MTRSAQRSTVFVILAVAVIAALGFTGYAVGRGNRSTSSSAQAARTHAAAAAFRPAELSARARAQVRGYHDGVILGRRLAEEAGALAGRRRAQLGPQNGSSATAGHCPKGQYTTSSGGCAAIPAANHGSPPANSPEGKKIIKKDPYCKGHPPPPPSYKGPVQC